MLQQRKGDQNMVDRSELPDRRLAHLEAVIDKYRQDFYAVGKALNEIRDARHYQKLHFKTFERYVNVRWDLSKSQAYRLIEAFAVIDNLFLIACLASSGSQKKSGSLSETTRF